MGPLGIVVAGPVGHGLAGVVDDEEQGFVQQFVMDAAFERLAGPILHGLAGGDCPRLSAPFHQGCEFLGDPTA